MRGHVYSLGKKINPKTGKREGPPYGFVIELGEQPAQVCPVCADKRGGRRLYWIEGKPLAKCPKCSGEMENVRERRQFTKSGFLLKGEADRAMRDQLGKREEGTYQEPTNLTVGEFLRDRWLPDIESSIAPSTFASYTHDVNAYLVPQIGHMRLRHLDPGHVNKMYRDLAQTKCKYRAGLLSASTRRGIHATLRRALRDAVRWGLVPGNVAALADPPRVRRHSHQMRVWTREQLRTFLAAVVDDRLFALWRLYATTGMRRGEALGLQWRHIDLDKARISVQQARVTVGYKVILRTSKTGPGRMLPVGANTVDALKAWRDVQADELLDLGVSQGPDTFVFTDKAGEPLHPDRVTKMFEEHHVAISAEIAKRHKESGAEGDPPAFPRIRLHDVRHTYATLGLLEGVHAKVMSERLGHANIMITLDTYSHVLSGMQESAAELIEASIDAD